MDQEALRLLAEKYTTQGYDVKLLPSTEELPDFARRSEVHILARKGQEIVLVQINERGIASDIRVADIGFEYVVSLILEAEQLLSLELPRSALLTAWAAFEAAARDFLRRQGVDADRLPPSQLLDHLGTSQSITAMELDTLRSCFSLRNTLVHGLRPESISAELVGFLIDVARRLTHAAENTERSDGDSGLSATVVRSKLNKAGVLKDKVIVANGWLQDVLGKSRRLVTAEWDLAEDARVRPVVTLTLSDYTGTVTTTFDPVELTDKEQMQFRLNRLWGNLLEIRFDKEIEGLFRAPRSTTVHA